MNDELAELVSTVFRSIRYGEPDLARQILEKLVESAYTIGQIDGVLRVGAGLSANEAIQKAKEREKQ